MLPAHLSVLRPAVDPRYEAYLADHPEPASSVFGSATAAAIVSLLSLHPDEGFSLVDLELRTGASYESLHRVLRRLERGSILSIERTERSHIVRMRRGQTTSALRTLTLRLGPLGSRLLWVRLVLGSAAVWKDSKQRNAFGRCWASAHSPIRYEQVRQNPSSRGTTTPSR